MRPVPGQPQQKKEGGGGRTKHWPSMFEQLSKPLKKKVRIWDLYKEIFSPLPHFPPTYRIYLDRYVSMCIYLQHGYIVSSVESNVNSQSLQATFYTQGRLESYRPTPSTNILKCLPFSLGQGGERDTKTACDELMKRKIDTHKMTNDVKSKEAPGDPWHFSKGRGASLAFLVTTSLLAPPCISSLQTLVLDNHLLALQDSFNTTTASPPKSYFRSGGRAPPLLLNPWLHIWLSHIGPFTLKGS